jgi:hypothetical protein
VVHLCATPNHHAKSAPPEPIATSRRGAHRPPYLSLAMVIAMKVVGIDKIKLFRNFIFQKSTVIFTGCQHLRWLFFSDFEMSKKSKNNKILCLGHYFDGCAMQQAFDCRSQK